MSSYSPDDMKMQYSGKRRSHTEDITFYTIADERYFIGAIGMVNSLRLLGHNHRVVVLDRGLNKRQRRLLGSEVELVTLPPAMQVTNPLLFKPYANLLHPRGIVVMLDSDLLVTRRLDPVFEAARSGQVCACRDPESERWFAEWERLFELPGRPRREPYLNSGFVAFSVEKWPNLLPRWWESCHRIWSRPTIYEGATLADPTSLGDQDALNAILMSEIPPESITILPQWTQPDMEQLRYRVELDNVKKLSCTLHDRPVTFVHFTGKPKPWQPQGWDWRGRHPYPILLRRLVTGRDTRVRVSRKDAPVIWFRQGLIGATAMRVLSLVNRANHILKWCMPRWA
jgi:hypothetical protein